MNQQQNKYNQLSPGIVQSYNSAPHHPQDVVVPTGTACCFTGTLLKWLSQQSR